MKRKRIVVIGGGAAGMMAAGIAANSGCNVILLERNKVLGKKLLITGKGRCNLTNNSTVSEVLSNIPTGSKFLHSVINSFSPSDTMEFFETLRVTLKTERGKRVFPLSDKASDVVDALIDFIKINGVEILNERALRIVAENNAVKAVKTSKRLIKCDAVILATGGMSYPKTGSTGDGYKIAKDFGHTITPLSASLVSINAEPDLCSKMQGLTLKNVRLSVYKDSELDGVSEKKLSNKPIFDDLGELLFTHFGLSGPLILSASSFMRDLSNSKYYVTIDLKPGLDDRMLDERLLRDFEKYSNRDFINALDDLLPSALIPVIIEKSKISSTKKVHSITRIERQGLCAILKSFRIDVGSLRPIDEAVITSGGIKLKEINPKTMESKLTKGLYFAGEIIDADAYTGGFNLQIAWSTAFVAALSASEKITV